MKAAIVTCVNEAWLALACVTLLSIAQKLDAARADLFIIVDEISEQGRSNLAEFKAHHAIDINLEVYKPRDISKINFRRYSSAAFLRLCLPEIISPTYTRVLYLDSDLLAMADVSPLLNFDLKGKALGAVPEVKMAPARSILTDRHRRKLGMAPNADYFNAGVLLFDWHKILENRILNRARNLFLSRRDFKYLDQDALNLIFESNWLALPIKWNVEQSAAIYLNVEPALRHFNHAAKPWDWPNIMAYDLHHQYYACALQGLALSRLLKKPRTGNPILATAEYLFRKASLRQRAYLRKRYEHLL